MNAIAPAPRVVTFSPPTGVPGPVRVISQPASLPAGTVTFATCAEAGPKVLLNVTEPVQPIEVTVCGSWAVQSVAASSETVYVVPKTRFGTDTSFDVCPAVKVTDGVPTVTAPAMTANVKVWVSLPERTFGMVLVIVSVELRLELMLTLAVEVIGPKPSLPSGSRCR